MRFQVKGQDRATGRRVTLDLQAESRAAAERKARDRGIDVHRVIDASEGIPETTGINYGRPARRRGGRMWKGIVLLFLLLLVVWLAITYVVPVFG